MMSRNLQRMIQLADEFFETKNDPEQISIDRETMLRLKEIHPSTMEEKTTSDGPVAWILVIPTTNAVMRKFLAKKINERGLLDGTSTGGTYEAVYLCSALVLPEFRRRGLAKRLAVKAIRTIRKKHPIKHLFCWAFSDEGKGLAKSIAAEVKLPLHGRKP